MLQRLHLEHFLPGTSAARLVHFPSYKTRKTGRSGSFGVLPSQTWRYDVAMGRNFQREVGRRLGFDLGLEDRILLASLGQKQRRLDEKKMRQLNQILAMKIEEAAGANENIAKLAVQFSRIKVNNSFTEASVYWLCDGVRDEEVQSTLEQEKHVLRKSLSEAVGANCPELRFVADRMKLMVEEMDRLFKKADYGTDYRTLSNTARLLGSAEEKPAAKDRPLPIWKRQLLTKKGLV